MIKIFVDQFLLVLSSSVRPYTEAVVYFPARNKVSIFVVVYIGNHGVHVLPKSWNLVFSHLLQILFGYEHRLNPSAVALLQVIFS